MAMVHREIQLPMMIAGRMEMLPLAIAKGMEMLLPMIAKRMWMLVWCFRSHHDESSFCSKEKELVRRTTQRDAETEC